MVKVAAALFPKTRELKDLKVLGRMESHCFAAALFPKTRELKAKVFDCIPVIKYKLQPYSLRQGN